MPGMEMAGLNLKPEYIWRISEWLKVSQGHQMSSDNGAADMEKSWKYVLAGLLCTMRCSMVTPKPFWSCWMELQIPGCSRLIWDALHASVSCLEISWRNIWPSSWTCTPRVEQSTHLPWLRHTYRLPYMLLESHGNMWELQFFLFELLVRNGLNEGECQLGSFAIVAPPTSQTERFISDKLHHKLQTFLGAACHAQPQSQVPLYLHPVHQLRSCLSDNSHFCKCGKVQHMDRQWPTVAFQKWNQDAESLREREISQQVALAAKQGKTYQNSEVVLVFCVLPSLGCEHFGRGRCREASVVSQRIRGQSPKLKQLAKLRLWIWRNWKRRPLRSDAVMTVMC